jgi:hypothetical protein
VVIENKKIQEITGKMKRYGLKWESMIKKRINLIPLGGALWQQEKYWFVS